jgi:hypothetical protein
MVPLAKIFLYVISLAMSCMTISGITNDANRIVDPLREKLA